jgi:hypothetical protein
LPVDVGLRAGSQSAAFDGLWGNWGVGVLPMWTAIVALDFKLIRPNEYIVIWIRRGRRFAPGLLGLVGAVG